MPFQKDKDFLLKYVYDFSKDGGAVSTISLRPYVAGVALAEGVIIKGMSLWTESALTSAGTPTITFGNSSDVDGFAVDVWALANAANSTVGAGQVDGALLWDSTADAPKEYRVGSAANTQDVVMAVGTAALTAGKLVLYLHCKLPSSASAG